MRLYCITFWIIFLGNFKFESARSLCDIRIWYLNLIVNDIFNIDMNEKQNALRNSIDSLFVSSSDKPDSRIKDCHIIEMYNEMLKEIFDFDTSKAKNIRDYKVRDTATEITDSNSLANDQIEENFNNNVNVGKGPNSGGNNVMMNENDKRDVSEIAPTSTEQSIDVSEFNTESDNDHSGDILHTSSNIDFESNDGDNIVKNSDQDTYIQDVDLEDETELFDEDDEDIEIQTELDTDTDSDILTELRDNGPKDTYMDIDSMSDDEEHPVTSSKTETTGVRVRYISDRICYEKRTCNTFCYVFLSTKHCIMDYETRKLEDTLRSGVYEINTQSDIDTKVKRDVEQPHSDQKDNLHVAKTDQMENKITHANTDESGEFQSQLKDQFERMQKNTIGEIQKDMKLHAMEKQNENDLVLLLKSTSPLDSRNIRDESENHDSSNLEMLNSIINEQVNDEIDDRIDETFNSNKLSNSKFMEQANTDNSDSGTDNRKDKSLLNEDVEMKMDLNNKGDYGKRYMLPSRMKSYTNTEGLDKSSKTDREADNHVPVNVDELERIIHLKTSDYANKLHTLELMIMNLEKQLLLEQLNKQNHTSTYTRLENLVLKLENDLLKMNRYYQNLKEETKTMHEKQNQQLKLTHEVEKAQKYLELPDYSTEKFELITEHQSKIKELSEILHNQSDAIQMLKHRHDMLEEQNRLLHQMVMNQTMFMTSIMQTVQDLSEQNSKNKKEISDMKQTMESAKNKDRTEQNLGKIDTGDMVQTINSYTADAHVVRQNTKIKTTLQKFKSGKENYKSKLLWCPLKINTCPSCFYDSISKPDCLPYKALVGFSCNYGCKFSKMFLPNNPSVKDNLLKPDSLRASADITQEGNELNSLQDASNANIDIGAKIYKPDDHSSSSEDEKVTIPVQDSNNILQELSENDKPSVNIDNMHMSNNGPDKIVEQKDNSPRSDDDKPTVHAPDHGFEQEIKGDTHKDRIESISLNANGGHNADTTKTLAEKADSVLSNEKLPASDDIISPVHTHPTSVMSDNDPEKMSEQENNFPRNDDKPDVLAPDSGSQQENIGEARKDNIVKLSLNDVKTQLDKDGQKRVTQKDDNQKHINKNTHEDGKSESKESALLSDTQQNKDGHNPDKTETMTEKTGHNSVKSNEKASSADDIISSDQTHKTSTMSENTPEKMVEQEHDSPINGDKPAVLAGDSSFEQDNIVETNKYKLEVASSNGAKKQLDKDGQKSDTQEVENQKHINKNIEEDKKSESFGKESSNESDKKNKTQHNDDGHNQDTAKTVAEKAGQNTVLSKKKVSAANDTMSSTQTKPKSAKDDNEKSKDSKSDKATGPSKIKERKVPINIGGDSQKEPKDCYEIYKKRSRGDGIYRIKPVGSYQSIEVFCDMKKGGWTVIQRRQDGSTDFFLKWEDYKKGFGGQYGDHWVGNDNLHLLTNQDYYKLRVDLMDWDKTKKYADYGYFLVESENEGYRLHIEEYLGDAGDGLTKHDGNKFSTKDVDNDKVVKEFGGSCANRFHGAGWYYKCYASNLFGKYYKGGKIPEKQFDGITWKPWTGPNYSMKKVVMKIRPASAVDR